MEAQSGRLADWRRRSCPDRGITGSQVAGVVLPPILAGAIVALLGVFNGTVRPTKSPRPQTSFAFDSRYELGRGGSATTEAVLQRTTA